MLSLTVENNSLISGTYTTNDTHAYINVLYDEAEIGDINGLDPAYFEVTIETISSNHITGYLTGNYLCGASNQPYYVTEGKFDLPIQ